MSLTKCIFEEMARNQAEKVEEIHNSEDLLAIIQRGKISRDTINSILLLRIAIALEKIADSIK